MKKKFQLEVPGGADRVLLHTCCAPCSSAIIECMMQHHITPVIYYCNPNIYPQEEYIIRKEECTRYAQSLGLEIIDADYDHENWRCHIIGMEHCGIDSKKMHAHAFRHFFAKMFLKKTKDVIQLADLLGHGSVDTTRIYLQKSYDEQQREFNKNVTW